MKMPVEAVCDTPPFATLSCLYVFVYVFDADVESWKKFLRTKASPTQVALDGPVVERLAASLREAPELTQKIVDAVGLLDDVAWRLGGTHPPPG